MLHNNKTIIIFCTFFVNSVLSGVLNVTKIGIEEFTENLSVTDKNISSGNEVSQATAECDCGSNSLYCKISYYNTKECTCKKGYAPKRPLYGGDETCEECDCGEYGDRCSFDILGYRYCTCKPNSVSLGFGDKSCIECECGEHSTKCSRYDIFAKYCECEDGYMFWLGDKGCTKIVDLDDKGMSQWQIWTIVAGVIFLILVFAIIIKCLCK